ncbi:MAG: sulfurtransferase [Gammaproteobacteria bacterium]
MDLIEQNYLVECDWLAAHLDSPDLRIVECTSLLPNYFEPSAADGLDVASGRPLFDETHIAGATYVDLLHELSDRAQTNFMYAMPSADRFAEVMSAVGVGDGTAVLLYDRGMNSWATRVWWMLRCFGFDNAAVLNGGWTTWIERGLPTSAAAPKYPAANFISRPRKGLIAHRDDVITTIGDGKGCLINALDPDEFTGRPPQRYARPGRIPGSVNVPFSTTVDLPTQYFVDDVALRQQFDAVGAFDKERVIAYCGGAIAASNTVFALTRLGIDNVSLYDGSLMEWTSDPDLPMETG